MDFDSFVSAFSSERCAPAADVVTFFMARRALVDAAMTALDAILGPLAELETHLASDMPADIDPTLKAIAQTIDGATVRGENLLLAEEGLPTGPFVMCSVNRQASGVIDIRTIELDPEELILRGATSGKPARPFDALVDASRILAEQRRIDRLDVARSALAALVLKVRGAICRLSIVKSRLDLQQTFLTSLMDTDPDSPLLRLDSNLNAAGARDMAVAARRLLSARALHIATGQRATLPSHAEHRPGGL